MRSIFRAGAVMLAMAALLTPAATANAKGGGGGGGGGGACATIDSFTASGGTGSITWSATTTNLCLDERAGSTAVDLKNETTGFVGRSVTFGRGTQSFGSTFAAAPGTRFTITVTVYAPSGKVQASQSKSVTA
jgi:hypothetical protein